MASDPDTNINEGVVLAENEIVCMLTNRVVKVSDKEQTLQYMIGKMIEEYEFLPADLERDYKMKYEDPQTGKSRTQKVDLAIFEEGMPHEAENLIRFIIVAKDSKVKPEDKKSGAAVSMAPILENTDCQFGCWTNGDDELFQYSTEDQFGQVEIEDIADFPMKNQTLEELLTQGEKGMPRKPANESLIQTFKRCHNYIYGNEGMKKTAFWELLNLIFCKLYDEKCRINNPNPEISYRRRFWVGAKERFTSEGQKEVAIRIKGLFTELKESQVFRDVFDGSEQIMLSDAGLAFVCSELAKYSFLDAKVDVKGTAYETIVSNTLKQEAGQFFTPRNVIRCMVEMLDPDEDTRVLDPACGSGGFLVMVLDHVRRKIAKKMYPSLDDLHLEAKFNTKDVNDAVREYAERMVFGFDFDPDLKKAARMNMVMAGDGHSNIFNINSLAYPNGTKPDEKLIAPTVMRSIRMSKDRDFPFVKSESNAQGRFDMIFTNPPFGAKVEVDPEIAAQYELSSRAPEVLFIEACYNYLKPGGKMGIVLPDGILGNPNTESVRKWILKHFKLLASVDLPVETFLPQVGVQASLLFLQKKTEAEEALDYTKEDYDVFMAIVEKVGKDRRGNPIYKRDDDGAELLFDKMKQWIVVDALGNEAGIRSRRERLKEIDDDLPEVSKAYTQFKEEHK